MAVGFQREITEIIFGLLQYALSEFVFDFASFRAHPIAKKHVFYTPGLIKSRRR